MSANSADLMDQVEDLKRERDEALAWYSPCEKCETLRAELEQVKREFHERCRLVAVAEEEMDRRGRALDAARAEVEELRGALGQSRHNETELHRRLALSVGEHDRLVNENLKLRAEVAKLRALEKGPVPQ